MNQGKLGIVKQEMARLNFDILGISKLKWTGMGEFNSDDHYTIIQEWQLPGTGVAKKRYPTYKVRRCGQEEIPHIQGQEQWL